jgi:hypothetical protein
MGEGFEGGKDGDGLCEMDRFGKGWGICGDGAEAATPSWDR